MWHVDRCLLSETYDMLTCVCCLWRTCDMLPGVLGALLLLAERPQGRVWGRESLTGRAHTQRHRVCRQDSPGGDVLPQGTVSAQGEAVQPVSPVAHRRLTNVSVSISPVSFTVDIKQPPRMTNQLLGTDHPQCQRIKGQLCDIVLKYWCLKMNILQEALNNFYNVTYKQLI